MITIEPGVYRQDKHGIRLENDYVVLRKNKTLATYDGAVEIVETPEAVSYTHLDVYKRQEVLKAIDRGLDAVILHPTGVIGPYEFKLSNTGQVISDFLNKRLFAYIDGAYDFVDVRDVALGIIQACEYGRTGENYILSGEQITVFNILKILEEETGIKAPKTKIPISVSYTHLDVYKRQV